MSLRNKILCGSFFCVVGLTLYVYDSLPGHIQEGRATTQSLVFLDRTGIVLRTYNKGETYDWLSLDKTPKELVELLLMAEDKNFYSHGGIDLSSSLRSLWLNARNLEIVSGASTVSQQVYRKSHGVPRNFIGKFKTLLGSLKIERNYSKKEILETYINTLPYGSQLVGVKRAGEVLFAKDLHLLSLPEMATLAVLPRSPSGLRKRPRELLQKRNLLINQYGSLKGLAKEEIQLALSTPLELHQDKTGWDNFHFTAAVMKSREFSAHISSTGRVETTLDYYLQRYAGETLRGHLEDLQKFNVNHGALVVLDNNTGDVLAYLGSQKIQDHQGSHFDALQIKRQPGSALKPLTYALALQEGKKLSDPLPDILSYYKTGLGQFLPRNYGLTYSGPRLMREALANSLNLPAVALAEEVGVEKLYFFYKGLGLTLPKDSSHYGVGMTLGNVEITPFELAEVYSSFARGGSRVSPRFFKEAPVITTPTPLTPEAAFLISDVLSDQIARREEFGESNPFDVSFPFSVKTGTSTDFRDNWAVGYNQHFTIVVWVGNTDQKPMKRVSGITGAGPVLADVARYLARRKMLRKVPVPSQITRIPVCALSGKLPGPHCPHYKGEIFLSSNSPEQTCDWHQEVYVKDCSGPSQDKKVKVAVLPDKYQSWVRENDQWRVSNQVEKVCSYKERTFNTLATASSEDIIIARPLSGSIYALDPNLPRAYQKLKLEINKHHEVKEVLWKKDGKLLKEGTSMIDWPLEKGSHEFQAEVIDGEGIKKISPPVTIKVL